MIETSGSSPAFAPEADGQETMDAAATEGNGPPAERHNVVREKVRIRFRKFGGLRFIGHNDLLRCFHRLLRRTGLKVRHSQGFHPMPRVSSPLALPLGVVGSDEVIEVEFEDDLPLEEIRAKLIEQAVPGLDFVSFARLPVSTKTEVVGVEYVCELPVSVADGIAPAIAALLAADAWPLVRKTPGKPDRRIDLKRWIRDVRLLGRELTFDVAVENGTTARPEELFGALQLGDALADGLVLQRTRVRLRNE